MALTNKLPANYLEFLKTYDGLVVERDYYEHFRADRERWPHYVVNIGGKIIYVPPDHFCFMWLHETEKPQYPSDSVWIVPGTTL